MEGWICRTCGTRVSPSGRPPATCPICADERQYIGYEGQQWTTLTQMQQKGFHNVFREHEPGLIGIVTTPSFAIGERTLLLQSKRGNILWDCLSFINAPLQAEFSPLPGSMDFSTRLHL